MKISLDHGAPSISRRHTLMIGNCGTLQGGLTIMPDADPYNGKLDLIQLNAKRIREWINTATSFVWDNGIQKIIGQQDSAKDAATVAHRQATEISASLSEPRVLEVDDEDLGKVSQFSGEVQPAALFAR